MKRITLVFAVLFLLSAVLRAESSIGIIAGAGPYRYLYGDTKFTVKEGNGTLGFDLSFAGSRKIDRKLGAALSGSLKFGGLLEPGVEYNFSGQGNDIIRDILHGYDYYAYTAAMASHSLKLSNAFTLAGLKIRPFIEGRYGKLQLFEGISDTTFFYPIFIEIEYREIYDINAGGSAEWQAFDWLLLGVKGNKRFYFNDTDDDVKATGGMYVQTKDIAALKTSVSVVDYSLALSADAEKDGFLAGVCYGYSRFHVPENANCSDFSQDITLTAGYEFAPGTRTGLECGVIINHYIDGYMLSSSYLNAFMDFAVK